MTKCVCFGEIKKYAERFCNIKENGPLSFLRFWAYFKAMSIKSQKPSAYFFISPKHIHLVISYRDRLPGMQKNYDQRKMMKKVF